MDDDDAIDIITLNDIEHDNNDFFYCDNFDDLDDEVANSLKNRWKYLSILSVRQIEILDKYRMFEKISMGNIPFFRKNKNIKYWFLKILKILS